MREQEPRSRYFSKTEKLPWGSRKVTPVEENVRANLNGTREASLQRSRKRTLARGGSRLVYGAEDVTLIIWLQGIWLPLHGYNYNVTPLWAGIYLLPLLIGFVLMGPMSGWLSDRFGARVFSTLGMFIQAVGFLLLTTLPANFNYPLFALLLFMLGLGQGMFSSPNTSSVMGSVPADQRGAASGMRATFQNAGQLVSIGVFFSIVTAGLASVLPATLFNGLTQAGVPAAVADEIAHLPPTSALFAAFLGYNPVATLFPGDMLHALPVTKQATLLGRSFFPNLISSPFMVGLHGVFYLSTVLCLIAAIVSLLRGKRYIYGQEESGIENSTVQEEATSRVQPSAH